MAVKPRTVRFDRSKRPSRIIGQTVLILGGVVILLRSEWVLYILSCRLHKPIVTVRRDLVIAENAALMEMLEVSLSQQPKAGHSPTKAFRPVAIADTRRSLLLKPTVWLVCHTSSKPVQDLGAFQSLEMLLSGLIGTLMLLVPQDSSVM